MLRYYLFGLDIHSFTVPLVVLLKRNYLLVIVMLV